MTETTTPAYQVLARKYRPETFADLIGQDAMVRTLKNAFEADRIAHAFIMTGIRGTGKTTTARIIAKGLNCVGPDGNGGPTIEPCGVCDQCISIREGRHVDVAYSYGGYCCHHPWFGTDGCFADELGAT